MIGLSFVDKFGVANPERSDIMGTVRNLSAAIIGMAIIVGACAGPAAPATEGTKAGPGVGPITLRIGTRDGPDRPVGAQIIEYARRVDLLSSGSIRIEPVWNAVGDGASWDQRVARMVSKDAIDMGLIPTRAWDTEGVTTLRPLSAPFLITTDALLDEVVSSDLAGRMLAGLDQASVVGLGLFPEGFRHPFGFGEPLFGPADYAGETIRTPESALSNAMYSALGAKTTDGEVNETTQAAMESNFSFRPSGIATGNVTFYPKVNGLVISKAAFERLNDQQREILRTAARETLAWTIENRPSDHDAAMQYCADGSSVVAASDADLGALEAAVESVYVDLEKDAETKSILDAIKALKAAGAPDSTLAAVCDGARPEPTQGATVTPIDGKYSTSFTLADLQRSPLLYDVGELNDGNWGDLTLTFDRGKVTLQLKNDSSDLYEIGTFTVSGDVVRFELPTYSPGTKFVFHWKLEGDALTFVRDDALGIGPTTFLVKPWTKAG